MSVTMLVELFVLPPNGAIVLLLVGMLVRWPAGMDRRLLRGIGNALIAVALVVLVATGIRPTNDALARLLEYRYPAWQPTAPAARAGAAASETAPEEAAAAEAAPVAIVVLGGGVQAASPDAVGLAAHLSPGGGATVSDAVAVPPAAALGPSTEKRLVHGLQIHRLTGLPIILSGGVVFDHAAAEPEAVAAQRLLLNLGVDPQAIFVESGSTNTIENARQVAALIARTPGIAGGPLILVTSAYHMPRSVWSFEQSGLSVVPAPTDYLGSAAPYLLADFIPNVNSWRRGFVYWREILGSLRYRFGHA